MFSAASIGTGGRPALLMFSEIEGSDGPVTGVGDSAVGNQIELGVVFADDSVQVSDDSDAFNDSATLANVGLDELKQMVLKVHAGSETTGSHRGRPVDIAHDPRRYRFRLRPSCGDRPIAATCARAARMPGLFDFSRVPAQ